MVRQSALILVAITFLFECSAYSENNPLVIHTFHSVNAFVAKTKVTGNVGHGAFTENWNTKFMSRCSESLFDPSVTGLTEVENIWSVVHFPTDRQHFVFFGRMDSGRLENTDGGVSAGLCVKTPAKLNSLAEDLLRPLMKKSISFWFDLRVTEEHIQRDRNTVTGQIVIGGTNEATYYRENSYYFPLRNLVNSNPQPDGWMTATPIRIAVDTFRTVHQRNVIFDIGSANTILPIDMYNAVVGPIKVLVGDQLMRKQNAPSETVGLINEFAGPLSKANYFPCNLAVNIKGFSLNYMHFPKDFLYRQKDSTNCELLVSPQASNDMKDIVVGFHIIKHFHLLINYLYLGGSAAIFSERKDVELSQSCKDCCVIC